MKRKFKGLMPNNLTSLLKKDKNLKKDLVLAFKEYKARAGILFPYSNGELTCDEVDSLLEVLAGKKQLRKVIPFDSYRPTVVSKKRLMAIEGKLGRAYKIRIPKEN